MASWQKKANKLLRQHYSKRDNMLLRFLATQYPKPTIAVVIWDEGEKLGDFAIWDVEQFIEDLQDAWDIIKPYHNKWVKERQKQKRKQRDEEEDYEEEEYEEEEEEETPKRRKKATKKTTKRKIKRD